jgi:hypothetical protein
MSKTDHNSAWPLAVCSLITNMVLRFFESICTLLLGWLLTKYIRHRNHLDCRFAPMRE